MKKIFNILSLVFIATAMIACDPVDEAERYSEATDINKDHKVLVEEYTGQFCPTCPYGHETLDKIKEMYGSNAVIVSIHSSQLAYDDPTYGLKTPEGDVYAAANGVQFTPSAVVNRTSGAMNDRSQWQGSVFKSALTAPLAKIAVSASVKDGKIIVTSDLVSVSDIINCKYQLWITEDNIVALQQTEDDYITDYVHNHVYRATINGIGGEDVKLDADGVTMEHTINVASNWNVDNINVVAFVYNSKGVLQAEEVRVNK